MSASEPLLPAAAAFSWRRPLLVAACLAALVPLALRSGPAGRAPADAAADALPLWAEPSGVPKLRIRGGPDPPQRQLHWVPRLCTELYEGPNCSNVTSWKGTVTLEIDGRTIHNVKLHTRGHSSAMFPKHQFGFKLPLAMPVLGMAPGRSWVLATSFVDVSFQRNPIAFDLYRQLGGWATETEYVNVDWHGQDYGLYYIGQRIGCGEGRLDVCHRDVSAEKSGYLLTIDWAKPGKVALKSNSTSTYFNVLYPAGSLRPSEHSFLQDLIDAVDRVAAGGPGRPLAELLDFRSFLRYFIVEELAKDVDGYSFSNFVKISEGRIFHAAPWDFDLAFNFACMPRYFTNILTGKVEVDEKGWNVENGRTDALWIGPSGFPGGSVREFGMNKRQLFLNIWRSPGFKAAFASTWRSVRHRLGDGALRSMVERRSRVIEASAERDLDIWKSTERCAFWRCCVAETHSFQRASQDLAEYLVARARWIDANVDLLDA